MLQLNSQAAQAALAQGGDDRLGDGVREAAELPVVPSEGQLPPAGAVTDFAALQAAALEAAEHSAADETPAPAADGEQAPQSEAIAEQWLLGMLGQHAVQVEVRDSGETGRVLDDSRAAVPAPASQWRSGGLAGLSMAAMQGAREAVPSSDVGVASTLLARAPVDPANPSSESAAPKRSVLESLDSQLPGQLQRASGQAAAVSAEAGSTAANPRKILSEAAAPKVTAPEPLDGQLLAQLERSSGQAAANPSKILGEAAAPKVAAPEPLDGQLLAQLERLSGQAAAVSSEAGTAPAGPGQTAQASGLERTLQLQAPEAKWGGQMLHALRETVELQLQQRVQHTTIRLDPPELGSLEIFLSHESGRLSVQISAAQGDVARLLQQTSERLRQELVGQNFLQVSVQVSADGQPGQQHERQARTRLFDEEPVMAGSLDAEQAEQDPASRSGDVLITV